MLLDEWETTVESKTYLRVEYALGEIISFIYNVYDFYLFVEARHFCQRPKKVSVDGLKLRFPKHYCLITGLSGIGLLVNLCLLC